MKKPSTRVFVCLSTLLMLTACQRENSFQQSKQATNQSLRTTGAIADDPGLIAKTHLIVSSDFIEAEKALRKNTGRDSDGDGVPDATDLCPTQKETVNGYQDTDGCPDTVPANSNTDTDGDGILDAQDGCPTEKETINGYLDADGCPDTPPTVVVPPATLPSSVLLTMPSVGYQGSEGSCVAFAVAYARSSDQYYRTGANSYSESSNVTSPEFLFNQIKTDINCSGSAMLTALEFLKNNGICTWQTMPYSSVNGCSLMPTSQQNTEALSYKIASYSKVYTSDITALKTLLASNRALLVTFSIDDNFKYAQPGYTWKSYAGTPSLVHAVTICGYDDSKNAFKIINSWGSSWGDQGYLWIDYDFFKTSLANFVFVMDY